MIKRAKRPDSNFYILNKEISEDSALTWAARGMLIFLLGKPDNWDISIQALVNETKQSRKQSGRDAVYAIIEELKEAGYITRYQPRLENGKMGDTVSYVSEVKDSPLTANPFTVNPFTAEPFAVNTTLISTDLNKDLKSNNNRIKQKENIKEKNAKIEKTQTTAVQAPPPHLDNNQDVSFLKASIVKTEPKGLSTKKNEQWLFLVSEFGTPEQVAKDFMQTRKTALTNTSLGRIVKQASIASISVSAAIEFAAGNAWQTFTAEYYANRIAQSNKQSAKPAKQSFSLGCDNTVDWEEEARKANEMHLKRRGGIPMTQQEEDEIPF